MVAPTVARRAVERGVFAEITIDRRATAQGTGILLAAALIGGWRFLWPGDSEWHSELARRRGGRCSGVLSGRGRPPLEAREVWRRPGDGPRPLASYRVRTRPSCWVPSGSRAPSSGAPSRSPRSSAPSRRRSAFVSRDGDRRRRGAGPTLRGVLRVRGPRPRLGLRLLDCSPPRHHDDPGDPVVPERQAEGKVGSSER